MAPLSRCLSATGIRFLGVLFPPGNQAPLTVGLPQHPAGTADPDGVSTFRTHETRTGLGALFTPEATVFTRP